MLVKLVVWLLHRKRITPTERLLLTNELLSTVGSLQIHSIITSDDAGQLHIRGKAVDKDQAFLLRESAGRVLKEPAYQIVREQTLYNAITEGVHKGMTTDQIQFSKSAIWFGEQELNLLKVFAGDAANLPLSED